MKISKLITQLEKAKKKHGDLEVLFDTANIENVVNARLQETLFDIDFVGTDSIKQAKENFQFDMDDGDGYPVSSIKIGKVDSCYNGENHKKYINLDVDLFKNEAQ